jgi:hypothetical protein
LVTSRELTGNPLMWTVQIPDVGFDELVVRDDIIGFAEEAVVAYGLADGSPTWTMPIGLRPTGLTAASDGTLYVRAWDGIAPFEGIHVLAFDPAHALLWDVLDAPVPDQERRLEEMIVDETGGLMLAPRLEHAVRVGDEVFALGCGRGEWMVPFPP